MARQFDRPTAGNLKEPYQQVRYFDKFLTALESANADLQSQITAIAAAQAAAAAAQTTANTAVTNAATAQTTANTANATATTANTTATTANTTANTVKRDDKITASATVPSTVLSASDAGSNATITIAAHVRQYGDGATLSVAGGSLTGKSYSTTYGIYYDDTTTADTTPTYTATTTLKDAQPGRAAGRHYVGQITTPASGGSGTSGGIVPPGGGGPYP